VGASPAWRRAPPRLAACPAVDPGPEPTPRRPIRLTSKFDQYAVLTSDCPARFRATPGRKRRRRGGVRVERFKVRPDRPCARRRGARAGAAGRLTERGRKLDPHGALARRGRIRTGGARRPARARVSRGRSMGGGGAAGPAAGRTRTRTRGWGRGGIWMPASVEFSIKLVVCLSVCGCGLRSAVEVREEEVAREDEASEATGSDGRRRFDHEEDQTFSPVGCLDQKETAGGAEGRRRPAPAARPAPAPTAPAVPALLPLPPLLFCAPYSSCRCRRCRPQSAGPR
jgi:hypothetical protein